MGLRRGGDEKTGGNDVMMLTPVLLVNREDLRYFRCTDIEDAFSTLNPSVLSLAHPGAALQEVKNPVYTTGLFTNEEISAIVGA